MKSFTTNLEKLLNQVFYKTRQIETNLPRFQDGTVQDLQQKEFHLMITLSI